MAGVTEPNAIADALAAGPALRRLPAGEVVIAEVSEETVALLQESVADLKDRRRDVNPCLIGIPADMDAVREASTSFEATLLVEPSKRDWIPALLPFLPALFAETNVGECRIGSARLFAVDVRNCSPTSGALLTDLKARRGWPLHDIAGTPDLMTFAAPPAYQDPTFQALSTVAPVVGHRELAETERRIEVAGFGFE